MFIDNFYLLFILKARPLEIPDKFLAGSKFTKKNVFINMLYSALKLLFHWADSVTSILFSGQTILILAHSNKINVSKFRLKYLQSKFSVKNRVFEAQK